jgi:hypothetical protein
LHVGPQAVPAPGPLHAARVECGDPLTVAQVPTEPPTSHASHCPPHARSQQTPSAQKPLPHSPLEPHGLPLRLAHCPDAAPTLHALPVAQPFERQQTPSTQYDEAHDAPVVQCVLAPSRGRQAPALQ